MKIENLTGLEKPLLKLIEVFANGIGAVAAPWLIKRQADALAQAQRLLSDSSLAIENAKLSYLPEQIAARVSFREAKRQENLAKIAAEAQKSLPENVSEKPVDPDWTSRFFSVAQDISNEDMQKLWGRLLGGEVAQPGTYSLRTLELIRNLSSNEARIFSEVCDLLIDDIFLINPWGFDSSGLVVRTNEVSLGRGWTELEQVYHARGITADSLSLLGEIGLLNAGVAEGVTIEYDLAAGNKTPDAEGPPTDAIPVGTRVLKISHEKPGMKVNFDCAQLTRIGMELKSIHVQGATKDFDEVLVRQLSKFGFNVAIEPGSS